jgi:NitT/TauT family transport system permease protein
MWRQFVLIAILGTLWQFGTTTVTAYYISTPALIGARLADWFSSAVVWPHLANTLTSTVVAFAIASSLATLLALVIANSRFLADTMEPILFAAFSTPKIVIAPLLIIWVGVGTLPAIALGTISAFFVIFYGSFGALRDVPKSYLDTAAVLGAGYWTRAIQFRLPAAAVYVLAALQQGMIYAFHGVILGEMTASDTGMGYLIVYSATSQDAASVFAGLVIVGVVSLVMAAVLATTTRRLSNSMVTEIVA